MSPIVKTTPQFSLATKKEDQDEWRKRVELWKNTFMKGSTDDELAMFEQICKRTGLSPEAKQIHAIPRDDKKLGKKVWTFQTSIDGFRLIAERTGRYAPGKEPTFSYDKEGKLLSATAYVKKMTNDGTWHEFAATAFYDEYVQTFKDYQTGKLVPTQFWDKMGHNQLAKCAESLALRKGFPADLSGIYTFDEMEQASNGTAESKKEMPAIEDQEDEKKDLLRKIIGGMGKDLDRRLKALKHYGVSDLKEMTLEQMKDCVYQLSRSESPKQIIEEGDDANS